MDRGEIAKHGYTVEQAANGGWVILSNVRQDEYRNLLAAFDGFESMLAFLKQEHEAHANRVRPQGEPA